MPYLNFYHVCRNWICLILVLVFSLANVGCISKSGFASLGQNSSMPPGSPQGSATQTFLTCPQGTTYADGCSAAANGLPQHPDLLDGYQVRPPWNVAGVDYPVGVPAHSVLLSWQTLTSNSGLSVNGNEIVCQSGDVSISNIDFSAAGGGYIYIPSGGCTSLSIVNSNWACPSGAWPNFWMIHNENPQTPISVTYSSFNGSGCSTNLYSWIDGYNIVFEYNYSVSAPVQIIQANAPGTVVYKYNMIDDNVTIPLQHSNDQEWDGDGNISGDDVEFNTTYQFTPACGEEFQFYNNNSGFTILNPKFMYNTLIALPATVTNNCSAYGSGDSDILVSYFVHGSDDGEANPTQIVGTALNQFNYFDTRGAFGAYYPHSMNGWESSGNVDMNSGASITPQ